METLTKIILTQIEDQQTAEQMAILFIAGAVFFIIFALLFLVNNFFDPVRLRFLNEKNSAEFLESQGEFNIYQKYSNLLLPSDTELTNRTTQRLHYAGYHNRRHLLQYYSIRFFLIILLPVLTLIALILIPGFDWNNLWKALLISAVLGYIGPSIVLDRIINKRQKTIQRAFPDALDLLVACTEAGLSLDASLQKVAAEIDFNQPELAEEINLVIAEVRAGVDRKKALIGLAERTGVEEIRGLMSAINQTMRFGSSIAQTLRVYAEDFRDKRMQAAEEKAAKIAAKLIFPTALCLLPCFILIIVVPFGMNMTKFFANM